MDNNLAVLPSNIILAGDSAGGGLCLDLLMYLRDNGVSYWSFFPLNLE